MPCRVPSVHPCRSTRVDGAAGCVRASPILPVPEPQAPWSMRKIPRRHAGTLLALFTSLLMSCLMSLVVTLRNVGFVQEVWRLWLEAFPVAFAIAFPLVLVVLPLARRLVERVTD